MTTTNKPSLIILHCVVFIILSLLFVVAVKGVLFEWHRVELRLLDNLRPKTFKYLYPKVDKSRLKRYEFYFDRVQQHMKFKSAEAFGLQGYCAYQRGDLPKAREYYQRAIAINPKFFWYYYNLGNIYLQNQDYAQAITMFQSALALDLKESFVFILSSGLIYLPIVSGYMNNIERDLSSQLKDGQQRALQLALFAKLKLENQLIGEAHPSLELKCY